MRDCASATEGYDTNMQDCTSTTEGYDTNMQYCTSATEGYETNMQDCTSATEGYETNMQDCTSATEGYETNMQDCTSATEGYETNMQDCTSATRGTRRICSTAQSLRGVKCAYSALHNPVEPCISTWFVMHYWTGTRFIWSERDECAALHKKRRLPLWVAAFCIGHDVER